MTTVDQLKEYGPKVKAIHRTSPWALAGKMRKNGCSDEVIVKTFIALIKNPKLSAWGTATVITKQNDLDMIVARHLKEKEDEKKFAGGWFKKIQNHYEHEILKP